MEKHKGGIHNRVMQIRRWIEMQIIMSRTTTHRLVKNFKHFIKRYL